MSRYARGAAAENALVRHLRRQPGTMAFRTPGSRGAADVIEILDSRESVTFVLGPGYSHVRLCQVKSGRKPSKPEIERLKARMRAESAFPCAVSVVWARPTHYGGWESGWEFVWL